MFQYRARRWPVQAAWASLRTRLAASDPGLARYRLALAATAGLGGGFAVEYAYALLTREQPVYVPVLLGGIAAMQTSGQLMQPRWQQRLRVAAWQSAVASAGVVVSVLALQFGGKAAQLSLFVAVTFVAVAARRFGPHFAVLGLVGWVAYLLAALLAPSVGDISTLIGAEVVSAVTVFSLSLVVWGHRPARSLQHALDAWNSQVSLLLKTATALVERGAEPRERTRLRARLASQAIKVTDTALLIDGWLDHARPAGDGLRPAAARDQLLEAQLAIDTLVEAAQDFAPAASSPESDYSAATRVTQAALDLANQRPSWGTPPAAHRSNHGYTPAVTLVPGGTLPGTAAVAARLAPRGPRLLARLSLPTRQAIQTTLAAAVALPVGYTISAAHYSWVLVAVFIVFLGPSTRGEITVKAVHRILGTVAGLVVAIPVAAFTAGQPLRVILVALVACFVGHYLMTTSYSYLMFCITVAILQFYKLEGEFSLQLLSLRLTETLIGAGIALLTAFIILPIRTRDATAYVTRGFFQAVSELLTDLADAIDSGTPVSAAEFGYAVRAIDDHARRHRLAGAPFTWHLRQRSRRRSAAAADIAVLAAQVHRVAAWINAAPAAPDTSRALRGLAAAAKQISQQDTFGPPAPVEQGGASRQLHHPLDRLQQLLHARLQQA